MDNQRLMIWGFFGLLAWITYQTWNQDYAPKPVVAPIEHADQQASPEQTSDLPALSAPTGDDIDAPPVTDGLAIDVPTTNTPSAAVIRVTTDVLDIEISTQGGTLQSAALLRYPVAKDRPDTLIELLSADESNYGAIRTGMRALDGGDEATHEEIFASSQSAYDMGGSDELVVPLTWQGEDGTSVEKRFRFTRGDYAITIEQVVYNGGEGLWRGADYAQLQRISKEQERSMFDVDSYSFSGPIVYNGEKSEKLKRDDLVEDGERTFKSQNGWLGAIEHHFLSAIVPEKETDRTYTVSVRGDRSTASMIGQAEAIAPGSSKTFTTVAFIGPKMQSQLEEIDETLKLTVDYGWLTIISQPLFWLLRFVFDFVGNWGLAIILVTFMIKLVFYKLTESSGRSMAKMRNLQPRMKALQDRYKDDKPALSQAMMELYKREKVNPAAGCLPILIQMPFFLAFYWVLLESVEMRQAPFALWITDLSTKDPYFILPLIMGAAMFMQQKLNPAPADPVQAKVMQIMPIMFTAFFAFFPSGLVLYWVTNTLLSIAQQWKINTVVEKEAKEQKNR
jgi:YidC/Oxa1 family membrane protein insertase